MRKVIDKVIIKGFLLRQPAISSYGNTVSTGNELHFYGHTIAWYSPEGVYISTCGYHTRSTFARLNALPGVRIYHEKGQLMLNGMPWDGKTTLVKREEEL